MKRYILILCGLLALSCMAQLRQIKFSGLVKPANTNFPLKGLSFAEITIKSSDSKYLKIIKTNDTGYFETTLDLNLLDACFYVEISARAGQKVITIDSICPYVLTKTPTGYFDAYETIQVHDTAHSIQSVFVLKEPLVCGPQSLIIYFDKNTSDLKDVFRPSADTVLSCMSSLIQLKKWKLYVCAFVHLNENNAYQLAKDRAEKIKRILVDRYLIDEKLIFIEVIDQDKPDLSNEHYSVTFRVAH